MGSFQILFLNTNKIQRSVERYTHLDFDMPIGNSQVDEKLNTLRSTYSDNYFDEHCIPA